MAGDTFGARLRDLRERKGLTQKQLGALVEMTGQAIHWLETGERTRPLPGNLRRLAAALDVTPEYLMFGVHDQKDGYALPPLETYLRETEALDDEQIRHVSRTLRAFRAERALAELQSGYETGGDQSPPSDQDYGDIPDDLDIEPTEEDIRSGRKAAYDRPELVDEDDYGQI